MKIVVYDIAASTGGGGETILDQYYNDAINDTKNEWWFFVSVDKYREYKNVHIVLIRTQQKSKLKSYFYRFVSTNTVIKRLKNIVPDKIISLQNMTSPGNFRNQTVYLHQSLQFSPVRFHFFKNEERNLAFRQKIICNIIRVNLHKAEEVIVQTKWMKEAVAEWAKYPESRIKVIPPRVSIPEVSKTVVYRRNHFIYPCNNNKYKNHEVLIEACSLLKQDGITDFQMDFTISSDTNSLTKRLSEMVLKQKLPINFVGHLSKEELFKKYTEEVVLFPSYIETFGLPLLEARMMESIVIASDLPFAHEILDYYEKAHFVKYDSPKLWAAVMEKVINNATDST